jgi:hypothetical protein
LSLNFYIFALDFVWRHKQTLAENEADAQAASNQTSADASSDDQTGDGEQPVEQPPAADAADQTGGDEDDNAARF